MSLTTEYRPLRIGFCVKEGSIAQVSRAAELNTLLSGGIYNPIISIGKDIKAAKELIDLFAVDLLYAVDGSQSEVKAFVESQGHLECHSFYGDLLFEQNHSNTLALRLLDAGHGFASIARANAKSLLPVWDDSDPLGTLFTLEYGRYPQLPNLIHNYRDGYISTLKAYELNITSSEELAVNLIRTVTPIDCTKSNLELYNNHGWHWISHGFYVGGYDDFDDLVNFWNIRAAGTDLVFIPIGHASIYKTIATDHYSQVSAWDRKQKFTRGVSFWHARKHTHDEVESVAKELGLETNGTSWHEMDRAIWNGLNLHPAWAMFAHKTVMASVDWRYDAPNVTFQLPEMTMIRKRDRGTQHLAIDIDPLTEFEYDGYTLKLPKRPDMNDWYSRRVAMVDELRLTDNNFSLIVDTHDSVKTVRPIKHDKLLKKQFEQAGITVKDSQAGLITMRLIEQMGELDSCRVFKIPGVRKLITSLKADGLVTRSTAKDLIRDVDPATKHESLDDHKRLFIQAREAKFLTSDEIFDFLLSQRLFRAGLEFECPSCRLKSWTPLDNARDKSTCEYCGNMFEVATQLRDRDWRYRRSGLLGRDNNQEGAIPVIITLMTFEHFANMHDLIYSTALKLDSKEKGLNCETDFAVMRQRGYDRHERTPRVEMVIGESKTNDEITEADIVNLSQAKKILEESGIKTFLAFSKTGNFTEAEIARFKALVQNNEPPILLTKTELEPYEPYEHYRQIKTKLPDLYTSSFEGLARNSKALYLEDKSTDPKGTSVKDTAQP